MILSDRHFIETYWLPRKVVQLKGKFDVHQNLVGANVLSELRTSCRSGVKIDRYIGQRLNQEADRTTLKDPSHFKPLFDRSLKSKAPHIYYFFGLEKEWRDYQCLVKEFGKDSPYSWRRYSDLVSLSCPGSTIHAHVDLIDVLIVQLAGSRRWEVWPLNTDPEILRMMNRNISVEPLPEPPTKAHVFDLLPGDGLYIPAMWPHRAYTAGDHEPALSVSIGWASLTRGRIIRAIIGEKLWVEHLPDILAEVSDIWNVLEDADSASDPAVDIFNKLGKDAVDIINRLVPSLDIIDELKKIDCGELAKMRFPCSQSDLQYF